MKVVINRCYGGFGLSEEAYKYMGLKWDGYGYLTRVNLEPAPENGAMDEWYAVRTNPQLVECVETLGDKASGHYSELVVVEIPDGINWDIDDYDGLETIEETHRSWR